MAEKLFTPRPTATKQIDVSSSSQRVQLQDDGRTSSIEIFNEGTATVWIEFGGDTITAAAATGYPVGAGICKVVEAQLNTGAPLYVAAIAAGSTGKIYFSPGEGI